MIGRGRCMKYLSVLDLRNALSTGKPVPLVGGELHHMATHGSHPDDRRNG